MRLSMTTQGRESEIINLFKTTFTASEGADEGVLISELVQNQLATGQPNDIYIGTAEEDGVILSTCIFTRLTFELDNRIVFLLSPMAVITERQSQGIGQSLLNYALDVLRKTGVDVVMTYGDPNFYNKVGFQAVREDEIAAPLKLQYSHGWLGQSLTGKPLSALKGRSQCVSALNDPAFW